MARGLIPAHAGKTQGHPGCWCRGQAHPRSRGENAAIRWIGCARDGLIPAHAGKTAAAGGMSSSGGAHPRSRGENLTAQRPHRAEVGSSPLTRGKPDSPAAPPSRGGLIPAHAGKTTYRAGVQLTARAHPRSRGENRWCSLLVCSYSGSSPLTRGKREAGVCGDPLSGLIPAHAGKTDHRGGE